MKKLVYSLTCLAVLFTSTGRADVLPFFSALRAEVANQLTIVSNTVPPDKKLGAGLRSSLMLIDRTKPTLVTGSATLGTLAKNLGKTSLSNTFLPILTDTRTTYTEAMDVEAGALESRLADTIPGPAQTAAQKALDKLRGAIDDAQGNPSFTLALTSLKKAAMAVGVAQKAVAKAETAKPGASFLSATITESNQGTTVFKPTRNTILDAYYDSFFGELYIEAADLKKLKGSQVQVRGLTLSASVPEESGTYTLSLTNESNALYGRVVAPNINEFNAYYPEFDFEELYLTVDPFNNRLGTGTMTITVDLDAIPAPLVWGTFAFTATGRDDSNLQVSMNGSFLTRLEVFDDE